MAKSITRLGKISPFNQCRSLDAYPPYLAEYMYSEPQWKSSTLQCLNCVQVLTRWVIQCLIKTQSCALELLLYVIQRPKQYKRELARRIVNAISNLRLHKHWQNTSPSATLHNHRTMRNPMNSTLPQSVHDNSNHISPNSQVASTSTGILHNPIHQSTHSPTASWIQCIVNASHNACCTSAPPLLVKIDYIALYKYTVL